MGEPGHDERQGVDERHAGQRQGLERDRLTYCVYTVLAGWAWFLYGFSAIVPLLVSAQGISQTVGGLHMTVQAVGGFIAGTSATSVVRRLTRRGTALLATGLVVAGTMLLLIGSPTAVTLSACVVIGTGGSLALNVMNPALAQHSGAAGPAALSEGNAVAAGMGLLAPLAVGAGVQLGLGWRPALLVTALLMAAAAVQVRRVPHPTAALDGVLPPRAAGAGRMPAAFWPLMWVVVIGVGVEFSVTTWTGALLQQTVGLSASASAAAVSAVVAGMALSRLVVSRLALRLRPRPILFGAYALTAAGWLVLWTAQSPEQAISGLVVTGLGIGGQFPLGLALMLASAPGQQDRASGALSVGIAIGIGVAPFALGALADVTDVRTAFLVVPVLLTAAGATLGVAARRGGVRPARSR